MAGRADFATLARTFADQLTSVEDSLYQTKNKSGEDPLNFPIRLNNRISALASVVGSADAPPTDQAVSVFTALSGLLQAQLDRLKAVLETDLPAFNTLVKSKDLPAVIAK